MCPTHCRMKTVKFIDWTSSQGGHLPGFMGQDKKLKLLLSNYKLPGKFLSVPYTGDQRAAILSLRNNRLAKYNNIGTRFYIWG